MGTEPGGVVMAWWKLVVRCVMCRCAAFVAVLGVGGTGGKQHGEV
jgi:hypothetical protein